MANYLPGDRVWVIVEGYDWWPARVIGEEQLEAPRRDGCNTTVAFYPGTTTPESTYDLHSTRDAHIICFFETSSQKAVTSNADLQAAIQHALADDAANPLQSANVVAASASVPAATTTSAAKDKSRRKRDREEVGGGLPSSAIHNNGAHNQANSADFRSLSNSTLMELGAKISAAVDAADLATLRTLLCRLEHVDVSQSALSHTGIGVAVGSILGSSACKSVWPLARAFISFWARHLPPETLDAIRRIQESSRSRLGVMEPTSPTRFTNTSPLRIQPISSPTFDASPSSSAVFSPTGVRTSFAQTVRMLLDSPNNNSGGAAAGADVCDRVAKELTADITDTDDRILLISRLRNPDLAFLRENLLTKRWTPRQYLEQPEEVFKTTKEKADEQQRLRLLMEATERAKTAHLRITELIACPDCGKKRAHFYEQQTRGADEPTTKFFTCLECKRTWTEE